MIFTVSAQLLDPVKIEIFHDHHGIYIELHIIHTYVHVIQWCLVIVDLHLDYAFKLYTFHHPWFIFM